MLPGRVLVTVLTTGVALYAAGSVLVYSQLQNLGFWMNLLGLFALAIASPFWTLRVRPKSVLIALVVLGTIELLLLHSRVISDDRPGIIFLATVVAIPLMAALMLVSSAVRFLTQRIR